MRQRQPRWVMVKNRLIVAALVVVFTAGTGIGCRTIMGIVSGRGVSIEDIARDIHGVYRMAKAAARANKAITPEDEYFLGRAVAVNVLNRYQYRYLEYGAFTAGQVSPGLTHYLYHVGRVLIAASERDPMKNNRLPPLAGYHFIVLHSPEINAFAAPGGYIFITTGMLRIARNESEIAAIVAHELAHTFRGHGVRIIKKARWANVGKIFLQEATAGVFGDYSAMTAFLGHAVGDIIEGMVVKGYGKKLEYEADWAAARLLQGAGYNPWALYNVLKRMDQMGVGRNTGMFATHPSPMDRMKKLYKLMPKSKYPAPPQARAARFTVHIRYLPAAGSGVHPLPLGTTKRYAITPKQTPAKAGVDL